ncbi:MAG: hypothetical protein K0Q49_1398 [Haloplasmataceae bacterium]|jgi:uncharacterized membrane protein|nr:hypothetical protein [Haloplasmataceae bacterium]
MKNITFRKKMLNYFIKTLNGMALGLFATLIIGVIIDQIGNLSGLSSLNDLGTILKSYMGVGIGIGVAWSLGLVGLPLIAGAISGGIATKISFDPMVAYLTSIVAIEGLRFILPKKTPLDIILIPLISSIIAFGVALLIGEGVTSMMNAIGVFINEATFYQPFIMGLIISVIMGIALTAPISSAAIAISINLSGIAGGAAVVGCSVQMLGFAIMSRKDNNIGEVISIGIGTSMLQFKNILRKPVIWLPTIIVSAILGPISTLIFKTQTTSIGSGMGTSGLVGQIGTLNAMGYSTYTFITILILQFALPLILVYLVDIFFRHKKWIIPGDLSLDNKPIETKK